MIVLNVYYRFKEGQREAYLDAVKAEGLDEASRQETGNIKYDYYMAADDPCEMILVEHWKDQASISFHNQQEHFLRMGELKKDYVEEFWIDRFELQ